MSWKEMFFQGLVGLMEILAAIAKTIGILLIFIIRVWEPVCCAALGFILGQAVAELIGLEAGDFRTQFQLCIAFLGLVFGAAIATRRLKKSGKE